ncbi:MAG: ABC transporter substrate-binding protein [Chloroflexi bacterium]|nr:ABC transporter substrate-binding protein [Chloroflexota bacterium]
MLAALVKAGKLPPVEQRLPVKPYVVPHPWLKVGNYGGKMHMLCSDTSDWQTTHLMQEGMYGHSILRWLKDGLAIGPGLAESWESNTDQSVWTFHFRKGLKWSDGHPWTTGDILFWWEDEVLNTSLKLIPPPEAHSGKGTLWKMTAPDANTLVLTYDSTTPLTADRLAMWVKRGIGPHWMDPKHYLSQFMPKYNPKIDKKNWVTNYMLKRDWTKTVGNPTMTGWKLVSYTKGQSSVWDRNPYYWVVDKEGNQLPYLDGVTWTNIQDPQVFRLSVTQGKADYVHGAWTSLGLADVATLKSSQAQSNLQMWFWDSGSGTGSMYFFNRDIEDPKLRQLFRNGDFLKAMSHAYNRDNARKVVYFEQGELTTGTMSPKAIEWHIPGGQKVYQTWRDSALKYDPALAGQMLDKIGVKKSGQWRTLPDGSPLTITLDYPANADPNGYDMKKNALLAKDWQNIGVNAKENPVTPASFGQEWAHGKLQMNCNWEVGDGPNCLVYPQWLVPLENARWAPMEGVWNNLIGTPQENQQLNVDPYKRTPPRMAPEKGGPIEKIWQFYLQTQTEPDATKRAQLVWDIVKIHYTDGPFFCGTAANYPQLVLVKNGLNNVPTREDLGPQNGYQYGFTNPWVIPSPAVYDPETYFWTDPSQHNV